MKRRGVDRRRRILGEANMATTTHPDSPILLNSVENHRSTWRSDWWVMALLGGLMLAMLAGLARHVDPKALQEMAQDKTILLVD